MPNDPTTPLASPADPPASHADAALYCPACGYDLRGTTATRCSECGTPFDRATLNISRLPWVHRQTRGRLRALRQTTWLVIRHPQTLSEEMATPVNWPAANRFRWVMVALATTIVALTFAAVYHWWPEAPQVPGPLEGGNPAAWPMAFVLEPWGFGPALVIGTAIGLAAASWWIRMWFWLLGGQGQPRASALSLYLSPWMIATSLLGAGLLGLRATWDYVDFPSERSLLSSIAYFSAWSVAAGSTLALLTAWINTLLLLRRTTRCGWIALTIAAVAIPLGTLISLATALFATAYALGTAALMLRSLW